MTMAKGFFITATDTGVGKTVAAGTIIRALKREGLSVCGMKPVESGCKREGNTLMPADGKFLKEVSEADEPIENITPVRFKESLAPWVAAERKGTKIDLKKIWLKFKELSEKYDAVVVEGIGGLLVPIKREYFVSDLAADIGLPVIVVASAYLGTINHTLLTVEHARSKDLDVAGIIFNHPRKPEGTVAEKTNPDAIEDLAPVPVIGVMPYLKEMSISAIEKAASENLDLEILRKYL
jgi:dethiobiotin synthetase